MGRIAKIFRIGHELRSRRPLAASASFAGMQSLDTFHPVSIPRGDEAHVWVALVSEASSELSSLRELLSPEEQSHAARFVQIEDHRRFIIAHGILRSLLGQYLGVAPSTLAFVPNSFGKPALAGSAGGDELTFNLTHAGDVVAFVIASGRKVGIDVETVRTDWNLLELAQSQFSEHEVAALQSVRPPAQAAAFFRCWTRKEAYVKARGEGLGFPLKQFSVAFGENDSPALLWASDEQNTRQNWSMFHLSPAANHLGAVVVEGQSIQLVIRRWRFEEKI